MAFIQGHFKKREGGTNHFAIAHKKLISNVLAPVSRSQQTLLHNENILFYFIFTISFLLDFSYKGIFYIKKSPNKFTLKTGIE